MDARIEATLRSVVCAIPGVTIAKVRSLARQPATQAVDVELSGWSPSLHAHAMAWKASMRRVADPDVAAQDLLENLSIEIGNQRRRFEEGLAMGRATPLPIAGVETRVGHLLVDRGLLDLMTRSETRPLRSVVAESIANIHGGAGSGRSSRLDCDDWIEGRRWHRMERVADRVVFDGEALWMGGVDLSETARMQCVGRPLGEIADVPACIADHVATEARSPSGDEGGTEIMVEPRPVTIDDYERAR